MITNVKGRELDIEFTYASQGFRIDVTEWDGTDWIDVPNYNGTLMLMQTQFEALIDLSSDLFDEAVFAEIMAEDLGVEMQFYDDDYDCACDQCTDCNEN